MKNVSGKMLYGMFVVLVVLAIGSVAREYIPNLRVPVIIDIPTSGEEFGPWLREQKYYAFAYTLYALSFGFIHWIFGRFFSK